MAQTMRTDTLEELDHLEQMAELMVEEIKKVKSAFVRRKPLSLRGILKGAKISEKDFENARKSLFREVKT